jgi:nucleotide-binding universal stress UspA family protein
MIMMIAEQIVVGLDDSAASRAAHRWAAEYAQATGMHLCTIHVLDWPIGLSASSMDPETRLCVPKRDMAQRYWRGMHRVFDETRSPQGSVLQFAQGDVGDVLVRLSADAGLLVVGTHEPIQGRPYLVGSISHYCISYATCPVVTVPAVLGHAARAPSGGNSRHDEPALVAAK